MKDWKNILTNICGLIILICAALVGISTQVVLPSWVMTACIIAGAVCGAIVAWTTGKKPDLSKKEMPK